MCPPERLTHLDIRKTMRFVDGFTKINTQKTNESSSKQCFCVNIKLAIGIKKALLDITGMAGAEFENQKFTRKCFRNILHYCKKKIEQQKFNFNLA